MDFEAALEHALNGDALLFVGAGSSREATNIRGSRLKSGADLARHLSGLANLPEDTSLDDAAEEFTTLRGEYELLNELRQEYSTREAGECHLQIARVPWRRIYTTNYDNVME